MPLSEGVPCRGYVFFMGDEAMPEDPEACCSRPVQGQVMMTDADLSAKRHRGDTYRREGWSGVKTM
ncbi:hypothetical protein P792_14195 [Asaia sp. SF2.1]|nr:hypothetical protein P792_14195 [Asaia sp. SF2.1]